jgi:hypothetical protein
MKKALSKEDKRKIRAVKESILKCLTEDFTYGTTKRGMPLKRPKENQALFRLPEGFATFSNTNLTMVMEAVVLGIYLAYGAEDDNSEEERK